MASYAVINSDNLVTKTIKLSNDIVMVDGEENGQLGVEFLQQTLGTDNTYVQFFFSDPENLQASIGDTYIVETNTFKSVQPFPSWSFNETLKKWEPPSPRPVPEDEFCLWSETNQRWYDTDGFTEYHTNFDGTDCECQASLGLTPATNPIPS